jgi:hypothetical protein
MTAVEKVVEEINKDLSKYFELNDEKNEEVVAGLIPAKTISDLQKNFNIKSLEFRISFREECETFNQQEQ